MSNLTDRYNLLSRVIKQRAGILDKLKDEFNEHTKKANSTEYRWQKLAQEDMRDRARLKEPLKVLALIQGTSKIFQSQPCTYVIAEGENEWYLTALKIVRETIEYVLDQPEKEKYFLHWSS